MAAIVVLAKQKGSRPVLHQDCLLHPNNTRGGQEVAELEAAFRRVDVNRDGKVRL